jgi:hypothetical protein
MRYVCTLVFALSFVLLGTLAAHAEEAEAGGKRPNLPAVQNENDSDDAPVVNPAPVPGVAPEGAVAPAPTPTPVASPAPALTPAPQALPGDATAKPGTPAYLRKREAIKLFDPGRGEELSPLQAAAQMLSKEAQKKERRSLDNIQNLITMDYDLTGANEAAIVEEAQTRALMSAAARLYFSDYVLLGRDLLEPYLRANGRPFVARTTVTDKHIVSTDAVGMSVRVSVNLDALFRDLNEKHFIAKPNLRPVVSVHLAEMIEGKADTSAGGRMRIEQAMDQNLFRVFSRRMKQPPLDADLSLSPQLLQTARFEAQRNSVDVLVTGMLTIRPIDQTQILYDRYAFMDASVVLKMYRVDTGELLAEITDRYSANGESVAAGTKNALDAMLTRSTQKLADRLRNLWGPMMLDDANCRLLITGVEPGRIPSLFNMLKALDPNVHVFQKAYYGDVLVVNVEFPDSDPRKLVGLLRQSTDPQFNVSLVDKHRISLEML